MSFGLMYKRSDRVSDMIREVICEMLLRDLNDPRLESITLTGVELTSDLRLATVYFSARGSVPREEAALHGFQSSAGYIKKKLGRELRLRYTPDLIFKVDRSFEYGTKIDRLIQTIKEEKDGTPPEDG